MANTIPLSGPESVIAHENDTLYEVVDGCTVELATMGAYSVWIAAVLMHYLTNFARQHRLGRVVQEMLFDFTAILTRKRRPDVAFVSYDRWPLQRRVPATEAWEVVPNLAIEVVSPSDTIEQVMEKVAEYFQVGVERVWVILPSQEQVYVYESPIQVHILSRIDTLHGDPVLPQFQLRVAALFDESEAMGES